MRLVIVAGTAVALTVVACARSSSGTAATATPVAQAASPVGAAPAGGAQPARPRPAPPSPMRLDTLRKQAIAEVLATIKGRENEPAGTVFKNVKLHKDMPAKAFLEMMDVDYSRSMSFLCTNCHMENGNWASDERKNKVIARQMERMQRDVNAKYLVNVKELDDEIPKVTCTMCHRGTPHMPNTMDVPSQPVPQRRRDVPMPMQKVKGR